jgi:hypothetical protein
LNIFNAHLINRIVDDATNTNRGKAFNTSRCSALDFAECSDSALNQHATQSTLVIIANAS